MEEKYVEIFLEDIRGKFDLVLEGHDVLRHEIQRTRDELNEKIDFNTTMIKVLNNKIDSVDQRLSEKIDSVEQGLSTKLDAIATDLSDHRQDTELHGRYQVSEKP